MASANNTIKTRIQLKSDTEENWNKSVLTTDAPGIGLKTSGTSFVPLRGELIVYLADERHAFSRLKVGDGTTNVALLSFVDSVTLNGQQPEIVTATTYSDLPQPGSPEKLYIVTSTNTIYNFSGLDGYQKLSNFEYTANNITIGSVARWIPGTDLNVQITDHALSITGGVMPTLIKEDRSVVGSISRS